VDVENKIVYVPLSDGTLVVWAPDIETLRRRHQLTSVRGLTVREQSIAMRPAKGIGVTAGFDRYSTVNQQTSAQKLSETRLIGHDGSILNEELKTQDVVCRSGEG
jgi:hypothetical protein